MRVMLDTNILISALYYPSATTWQFFSMLADKAEVVLCDYVISELQRITQKKFSDQADVLEIFLKEFPCEVAKTPTACEAAPNMRDPKDMPILMAAIAEKVDILVSGYKDFLVLDIQTPRIMSMADFIAEYV